MCIRDSNYGMLFTGWGTAGIIGPRIGGVLYDRYHNYQIAFYTASVLAGVALVAAFLSKRPPVVPHALSKTQRPAA